METSVVRNSINEKMKAFSLKGLRVRPSVVSTLLGAIIGGLFFIGIYGVAILDITYDDWIRNATGDFAQSYYGWKFYRASAWHWPIGLMDGVADPSLTPIMYIDSVPLFDVIFKVLSPALPAIFQFFGIWGLCCFMLNGAVGARIIFRLTDSVCFSAFSSAFFALTTFSIQRLYTHTALAANWVILLGILLIVTNSERRSPVKHVVLWGLLFFLAISVNMYYVPIIGILMLIESIYIAAVKKTVLVGVSEFGASLVGVILAFYIYGGFYHIGSTSVNGGGLGHLGANLNALFNPLETGLYLTGWSKFMKTKPVAELGQYEGYSYLGLGLMLLLIIAIAGVLAKGGQWIKEQWNALRVEIIYICCAGVLLLVASFGTDITLNDRTLLHIPYPDFFLKIYGIFRSTGRFMWGVWDLVVIATLVVVYRTFTSKVAALLTVTCLLLQISDLSPMLQNRTELYKNRQQTYSAWIKTEDLDSMLEEKKHVMIFSDGQLKFQAYYDIAEEIIDRGIYLNDFYYSRRDTEAIESYKKQKETEMDSGAFEKETLYVFDSYKKAMKYQDSLHLYYFGGLLWGSVNPVDGVREVLSITPTDVSLSKDQVTVKNSNSVEYLGLQFDGDNAGSITVKSMSPDSEVKSSHDSRNRALGIVKIPKDGPIGLERGYSGKVEGYWITVK